MITVSDVSVSFSEKPLFKDVNLKFNKGNCYGITGANGDLLKASGRRTGKGFRRNFYDSGRTHGSFKTGSLCF